MQDDKLWSATFTTIFQKPQLLYIDNRQITPAYV